MVSDMDRAVDFYAGVLGFHLKERYGPHWATVEGPGITVGLHPASDRAPPPGTRGALMIGLGVRSLDAAVEELQGKGVQFTPQSDPGGGRVSEVFFSDPDGNQLYLIQLESGGRGSR